MKVIPETLVKIIILFGTISVITVFFAGSVEVIREGQIFGITILSGCISLLVVIVFRDKIKI